MSETTLADLLTAYAASKERTSRRAAEDKEDAELRGTLMEQIREEMRRQKLTEKDGSVFALKGVGKLTVEKDKCSFRYDPDKWNDLVEWASSTGNQHIIQRRLNDSMIEDLVDVGVELPAFITPKFYDDIKFGKA